MVTMSNQTVHNTISYMVKHTQFLQRITSWGAEEIRHDTHNSAEVVGYCHISSRVLGSRFATLKIKPHLMKGYVFEVVFLRFDCLSWSRRFSLENVEVPKLGASKDDGSSWSPCVISQTCIVGLPLLMFVLDHVTVLTNSSWEKPMILPQERQMTSCKLLPPRVQGDRPMMRCSVRIPGARVLVTTVTHYSNVGVLCVDDPLFSALFGVVPPHEGWLLKSRL